MKITFPLTPAAQAWASALQRDNPAMGWGELESFLSERQAQGAIIYPSEADVLRAFSFAAPEGIRVCILGQD